MGKITLKEPDGPYKCVIDSEVMLVELRETFIGVEFVTKDGEKLAVSMRDSGFEIRYSGDFGDTGFNAGYTEFKNGQIRKMGERKNPFEIQHIPE